MEAAYQGFRRTRRAHRGRGRLAVCRFRPQLLRASPVTSLVRNWSRARSVTSSRDRSGRVLIVDGAVVEHDSDVALVHRFSDLDSDPGFRGWSRLITTNWPGLTPHSQRMGPGSN